MPVLRDDRANPVMEWALDEGAIRDLVGLEVAARGREYALRGAVRSMTSASTGAIDVWMARVTGSARAPYTVVVRRRGQPLGSCTCPMRVNCKHVAAVLFELSARGQIAEPSAWEYQLGTNSAGGQADRTNATAQLAIQFEITRGPASSVSPVRLEIRPVVRGASGRWVRTAVSWSSLRYRGFRDLGLREGDHRLLEEILALNASTGMYSYGHSNQDRVFLDSFPSRRIWDILAEAGATGIPLVGAGKGAEPVELAADAAIATLDVDATDSVWTVRPVVATTAGEVPPESSLLLGKPAHGIAWWPTDQAAVVDGEASRLSLARLERPLDTGLQRLFVSRKPIAIPEPDQQRFLREFYPGLRRRASISSLNGTFEAPVERTRLQLTARHGSDHTVAVEWSWTHSVGDVSRDLPLWRDVSVEALDEAIQREALAAIEMHADVLPSLYQPAADGRQLAPRVTMAGMDAITFTTTVLPALSNIADVDVLEIGDATPYREASSAPVINLSGSQGSSQDWFDLAVTVSVDGQDVPFQDLFVALVENQTHLILPSGTYFAIDRPELRQLRALITEARGLVDQRTGSLRLTRFQASLWQELEALGTVSKQAAAWSAGVRRLHSAEVAIHPVPTALRSTLRPYQSVGFNWLAFLHENRLGGVLADDMGLGKTLQTLALMLHVREHDPKAPPFLVVAPTSVVGNWASECHHFAPDLKVVVVGATAPRRGGSLELLSRGQDLVITSYALFRIEFEDYARRTWSGLILDEAQAVKNHQSRGYQCARKLETPFKLAVTGTPMENNLMELWSMFSIVAPGLFSDPRHFAEAYQTPIERDGDAEVLQRLQRRIRPLMLRRTKERVAAELPEKLEQVLELDLNARHRRVYQTYLQRERQKVLGLLGDMRKNRFEIFRSLTLLRQVSIDPSLVDVKHRAIPSTKLDALMEQLADVIAEDHRALVFSQFTRFLGHVRAELDRRGIRYCYLDGATRRRPVVLEQFKTGDAPVFLISLKAGGVGLNLAEADYCFLLDPWWNPATEAQAVDRIHRIGQTRKVMVYRLVARDTIEEKVMALKARKQALFSSVIDGGGAASAGLTAADIRGLLE